MIGNNNPKGEVISERYVCSSSVQGKDIDGFHWPHSRDSRASHSSVGNVNGNFKGNIKWIRSSVL